MKNNSQYVVLDFGVRQGSFMSTLLFAVYVDDLAKCCDCSRGIHILYFMKIFIHHIIVIAVVIK